MAKKQEGPQFMRFFAPIIEVLKELGGSARPAEVEDQLITKLNISEDSQNEQLKSGGSRMRNKIHWARFYLAKAGILDSSERGVWSLTEKGLKTTLNQQESLVLFQRIHQQYEVDRDTNSRTKAEPKNIEEQPVEESEIPEAFDYRSALMAILKHLAPSGFERLCQRLLRESGFNQVSVTGRTGDGGIDGHGVLEVNPLVSFKVYFQCKRYAGTVGSGAVRDFRGAMMGRADKGIIITTGTFSADARKEAIRDGVPPIELVDGEKLIKMFETLKLGLIPRTTYEINNDFFEEFQTDKVVSTKSPVKSGV